MGEWETFTLGDLTENLDARRKPVKELERIAGPYPYYGASGIVDYVDDFLFEGLHLLVAEDGENLRTRKLPVAFLADGRFWVNNHAHIVRGNDRADTRFLLYALSVADITSYLSGSTMPKLTQGNLNRIPISAPAIDEQRKIASVLAALDDKIELNRRMNATLEAQARALFRDWFVDFGPVKAKMARAKQAGAPAYLAPHLWSLFPSTLDAEGKPEGWEPSRVSDHLELAYGKSLPAPQRKPGPFGVYGSGGLSGTHDEALIPGPTVIVGRKGTVGSLVWVDEACFPIDTVFYVKPRTSLSFCYELLSYFPLQNMNTDAAVPGLNRENVYRLELPNPGAALICQYDEVTAPLRAKLQQNRAESRTLAQTRDLLLPKLMSGEIRVREAQKFVEAVE